MLPAGKSSARTVSLEPLSTSNGPAVSVSLDSECRCRRADGPGRAADRGRDSGRPSRFDPGRYGWPPGPPAAAAALKRIAMRWGGSEKFKHVKTRLRPLAPLPPSPARRARAAAGPGRGRGRAGPGPGRVGSGRMRGRGATRRRRPPAGAAGGLGEERAAQAGDGVTPVPARSARAVAVADRTLVNLPPRYGKTTSVPANATDSNQKTTYTNRDSNPSLHCQPLPCFRHNCSAIVAMM